MRDDNVYGSEYEDDESVHDGSNQVSVHTNCGFAKGLLSMASGRNRDSHTHFIVILVHELV